MFVHLQLNKGSGGSFFSSYYWQFRLVVLKHRVISCCLDKLGANIDRCVPELMRSRDLYYTERWPASASLLSVPLVQTARVKKWLLLGGTIPAHDRFLASLLDE